MNTFVDTHAHLFMLKHSPLQEILKRANESGVQKIITVSTDEPSWDLNRSHASEISGVYYSLGLHPHEASHWEGCKGRFNELLSSEIPQRCVAIGEVGLDFYYEHSPRTTQMAALQDQLNIANGIGLPVIFHCRDAFKELYELIRSIGLGPRGGVMHCFTGGKEEAKEAVELGLNISFSGIVTFKNADKLREAVACVPLSRIFLETDCPFLAPVPYRGSPNEPSYLVRTAECLASLLQVRLETLAQQTTRNAVEFFKLSKI